MAITERKHARRKCSRQSLNVKGKWMMTKAATPLLRAGRGGAIVNISSATVMSGSPLWLHYVSSKGAISDAITLAPASANASAKARPVRRLPRSR